MIGLAATAAGAVGTPPQRVSFEEVRETLRQSFARFGTLPDALQTDGEALFIGKPTADFPTHFQLYLAGLGIGHQVIRPGRPTDNAQVERSHQTAVNEIAEASLPPDLPTVQQRLRQAADELVFVLPSAAGTCAGRPPVAAYPELLTPQRVYRREQEVALFDLARMDAYLAQFTWQRKVGKNGQISLGGVHRDKYVGAAYARQTVAVRFDPTDRHFVVSTVEAEPREIKRWAAQGLGVVDLLGAAEWPLGPGLQQLALPLVFSSSHPKR